MCCGRAKAGKELIPELKKFNIKIQTKLLKPRIGTGPVEKIYSKFCTWYTRKNGRQFQNAALHIETHSK